MKAANVWLLMVKRAIVKGPMKQSTELILKEGGKGLYGLEVFFRLHIIYTK